MFDRLFSRPAAVSRHLAAPLSKERSAYLDDLAKQGFSRSSLKHVAAYLLVIADVLALVELGNASVSAETIDQAAVRWANHRPKNKRKKPGQSSQGSFRSIALRWLQFIGRLKDRPSRESGFEPLLTAFDEYMQKERGLSVLTRRGRLWFANRFLVQLRTTGTLLADADIVAVDTAFNAIVRKDGYSRVSIQTSASELRSLLRFAEIRGWCRSGLASAVKGPRVYSMSSLPAGPSWDDVKRLLAMTEGDGSVAIRDHAILMLLAVYGLRSREVTQLCLEDFDWNGERLSVRSTKTGKTNVFPLARPVGDAVLRYVKQVRPRTNHRELFLSSCAPIRPLKHIWSVVGPRLRKLGVTTSHHGPHTLRHACATHLLAQGLTLKQIGDHLGHRDPDTTRIYAKVDLVGLRQVADIDFGGII